MFPTLGGAWDPVAPAQSPSDWPAALWHGTPEGQLPTDAGCSPSTGTTLCALLKNSGWQRIPGGFLSSKPSIPPGHLAGESSVAETARFLAEAPGLSVSVRVPGISQG